jgi:hypothetical protein
VNTVAEFVKNHMEVKELCSMFLMYQTLQNYLSALSGLKVLKPQTTEERYDDDDYYYDADRVLGDGRVRIVVAGEWGMGVECPHPRLRNGR